MFGTNTFSFLKIFLNQFVDSEDGKLHANYLCFRSFTVLFKV